MTHIRSINAIETYTSNILHALKERRQSHAIAYMREMIEQFSRDKVVKEMTRILQHTLDKKTLLCGIPERNKFALLMESCNQKNEIALEFLLSSYPIKKMSSAEFSKFVAFMLTNKFENNLIRNFLLQRNPDTLAKEMNQALFHTIHINNKEFWLNPLSLLNVNLLFEFGANLCSHVMELLKNSKALHAILYISVCDKQNIDLNVVKKLLQAGADIFTKNLNISSKTIYEYLQHHLRDLTWLEEEKYLDQATPEQIAFLIEKNHNIVLKNKLTQILLEKRKDELKAFYKLHPENLDKLLFNHIENASRNYLGSDGDTIATTLIEWGANALKKYDGISVLDIAIEYLRFDVLHLILQKNINQMSVSDQVNIYYVTCMGHTDISTLITHPDNAMREAVFQELKNPVVEQYFLKEMLSFANSNYDDVLNLGKHPGINERNRMLLLDYGMQHAKHELVAHIVRDSKHLSQDKLLSAINFLLDGKTEHPLQFEYIKFLRLINSMQLTDEEKKLWVAPLLLFQIHKAKTIPELMMIVDFLKSHEADFKYLKSSPDIIKFATKDIVCRMKAIGIIEPQIIFPDYISYQKVLAFLKNVSKHSLYAKHDQDFYALTKGKIIINEKSVLTPSLHGCSK